MQDVSNALNIQKMQIYTLNKQLHSQAPVKTLCELLVLDPAEI